jgi:tetratricopeptide (TPR) repeat protein
MRFKLFPTVVALLLTALPVPAQTSPSPAPWEAKKNEAQRLFALGDLDGSEKEWRAALTLAEGSGDIEPGWITCLVGLAYVYDKRENIAEAERLYELAMHNEEAFVGPTSPRFADWMPNLAYMYDAHGRPDKAEVLFKRAISIKTAAFGPHDVKVAEVLEQYAVFLRKNGRQTEAADQETRARFIRQKHSV